MVEIGRHLAQADLYPILWESRQHAFQELGCLAVRRGYEEHVINEAYE